MPPWTHLAPGVFSDTALWQLCPGQMAQGRRRGAERRSAAPEANGFHAEIARSGRIPMFRLVAINGE